MLIASLSRYRFVGGLCIILMLPQRGGVSGNFLRPTPSTLVAPDLHDLPEQIGVFFGWGRRLTLLWSKMKNFKQPPHYSEYFLEEISAWDGEVSRRPVVISTTTKTTARPHTTHISSPSADIDVVTTKEQIDIQVSVYHHLSPHSHARPKARGRPTEEQIRAAIHAQTAMEVAGLTPEQRQKLEAVREAIFGPSVSPERIRLADEVRRIGFNFGDCQFFHLLHRKNNLCDYLDGGTVVMGDRDAMLLAFLRRKHWKVAEVLKAFDIIYAWRSKVDAAGIFNGTRLHPDQIDKHRACWPTAFYLRDKEGDPIFVDRMRILDLKGLKKAPVPLTMPDMLSYYVRNMEGRRRLLFPALSRASGRLVNKYISIVDVSHLGPQHVGREAFHFMREMGNAFHENYTDMVKSLYVINAPWLFHKVWGLVKAMMSEETLARLKILSHDQAYKELAKEIPEEYVKMILDGDLTREREEERQLFQFLDTEAKALP